MDPISLILAALVAGAAAGAKETAGTAVKDAYAGLRALIARRLGRGGDAPVPPDSDAERMALEDALRSAGAGDDNELITAASEVLKVIKHADPGGWSAGEYNVTVSDSKGVVIGTGNTVPMTFND